MASSARPGPAPSSNKNAYAGANIGVPWSPLEGVTSLDPSDYVWAAQPPQAATGGGAAGIGAMWPHLGAMAMLQSCAYTGWPVPMPPGLPVPGVAPVRPMMPTCMPGLPIPYPGVWSPLQQVAPAQGHVQGQPAAIGAPKGKVLGQPAKPAKKIAAGKVGYCQMSKKSGHKLKKDSTEALPASDKCPEDFLDCMMDLNEEDLQQLLQAPLDTLPDGPGQVESLDGSHGNVASDYSDTSSFSMQKSPSCGSQHSETLPDDSMLLLGGLDLPYLKEVNSFPDLTELECLNFDVRCEEGTGKAPKAASQLKKKKGGGVSKKKGTNNRTAVPTFVDDECLKELEQMLGTGQSTEVLGSKPKGADIAKMAGNEKIKGSKNAQRNSGRKATKAS